MKLTIAAALAVLIAEPVSAELTPNEVEIFLGLPDNFYAVAGFWSGANMLCDLHGYKTHPDIDILDQLKLTDWLNRLTDEEYAIYKERQLAFFEIKNEQGTAAACDISRKMNILVK